MHIEQRTSRRQKILQRCLVRFPGARNNEGVQGIAYNISPVGIGIALPFPPAAEMVLEIEPWKLSGTQPLLARVVQTRHVEFLWFCGCELNRRLPEAELRVWLTSPRDWLDRAGTAVP
jgi:hypothetical protein